MQKLNCDFETWLEREKLAELSSAKPGDTFLVKATIHWSKCRLIRFDGIKYDDNGNPIKYDWSLLTLTGKCLFSFRFDPEPTIVFYVQHTDWIYIGPWNNKDRMPKNFLKPLVDKIFKTFHLKRLDEAVHEIGFFDHKRQELNGISETYLDQLKYMEADLPTIFISQSSSIKGYEIASFFLSHQDVLKQYSSTISVKLNHINKICRKINRWREIHAKD